MRAITLFLALVLALSAAHKARDPQRLVAATARLTGSHGPVAALVLVLAGAIEALAALCLVLPGAATIGAAIAAALWTAYAVALWRRRGATLDCGCDLVARPRPVGAGQVLRAVALAALALAATLLPASAQVLALDALAAAGALALYLAASEILAIPRPRWRTS
jgi:uncharacterized membrane protein YphA (DoxX/SURF4 family)